MNPKQPSHRLCTLVSEGLTSPKAALPGDEVDENIMQKFSKQEAGRAAPKVVVVLGLRFGFVVLGFGRSSLQCEI